MLQTIGEDDLQEDYRNLLKAFYSVLKSCDRYIRFALLTGIIKFNKISIFSDLNNLEDIKISVNLCNATRNIERWFVEKSGL